MVIGKGARMGLGLSIQPFTKAQGKGWAPVQLLAKSIREPRYASGAQADVPPPPPASILIR